MPLDAAIYEPARNLIFAVRGGRIFTLDPQSAAKISQGDFVQPGFGVAAIGYSQVNDRIYAACSHTAVIKPYHPGGFNFYNHKETFEIINPDTLAVETSFHIKTDFSGIGNWNSYESDSGVSSFLFNGTDGVIGYNSKADTGFIIFNPIVPTSYNSLIEGHQFPLAFDYSFDFSLGRKYLWVIDGSDGGITIFDLANPPDFGSPGNVNWPINFAPFDVHDYPKKIYTGYFNQVNSCFYAVSYQQFIYKYDNMGVFQATLDTGLPTFHGLHLRFNPYDSKLYSACMVTNSVVIIDPANADALTVKTGFDLPLDFVFTPVKTWVVQQGAEGLKELV